MNRFRALRSISERSESDDEKSSSTNTSHLELKGSKCTTTIKSDDTEDLDNGANESVKNEETVQQDSNENTNKISLRSSLFQNIKKARVKFTEKRLETKQNIVSHLNFFHKDVLKSDKPSCSYASIDLEKKPSKSLEVINEQFPINKLKSEEDIKDNSYYIMSNEYHTIIKLKDSSDTNNVDNGKEIKNENVQEVSNQNASNILLRSSLFKNIKKASVKFTEKRLETKNNIVSHLNFFSKDVSKSDKPSCSYTPMDVSANLSKSSEVINEQATKTKIISKEDYSDQGYYIITNEKSATSNDSDEGKYEHFYEDLVQIKNEADENKNTEDVKKSPHKLKDMISFLKFSKLRNNNITKLENTQVDEKDKDQTVKKVDAEQDENKITDSNYLCVNDKNLENMYDVVKPPRRVEATAEVVNIPNKEDDYVEPLADSRKETDYCDVEDEEENTPTCLNWMFSRKTADESLEESIDNNQQQTTSGEIKKSSDERTNMAARPLPVPIENEPFYMSVDRCGAEVLLTGQPTGTFLLRPSSQPNHAYTLSVVCDDVIHNVGVRRRSDGTLALGYARKGQRSFFSVASLLQYHRRRRLQLVAGGRSLGATCLRDPPIHYQVPRPVGSTISDKR